MPGVKNRECYNLWSLPPSLGPGPLDCSLLQWTTINYKIFNILSFSDPHRCFLSLQFAVCMSLIFCTSAKCLPMVNGYSPPGFCPLLKSLFSLLFRLWNMIFISKENYFWIHFSCLRPAIAGVPDDIILYVMLLSSDQWSWVAGTGVKILGAVKFNNTEWPFNDSRGREIISNSSIRSSASELSKHGDNLISVLS